MSVWTRRVISLLLASVMVLAVLPTGALATAGETVGESADIPAQSEAPENPSDPAELTEETEEAPTAPTEQTQAPTEAGDPTEETAGEPSEEAPAEITEEPTEETATPVQALQALIDALPEHVTEDNREDVTARLQEILALYAGLTGEEQEQVDITRCALLQGELDAANAPATLAEETGAFTVEGGKYGTDYSYESNVLTIRTDTPLTISGSSTADRIAVADGVSANLTLKNVDIDVSSDKNAAAFSIADNSAGNVTITLEGNNTLKSGNYCAGLQKNGASGALTITGSGSLTAISGGSGAGIGGSEGGSTSGITIEGGTVSASSRDGAGIGGGSYGGSSNSITITGGTVTASSAIGAGIGGGYFGGSSNSITITGGTVTASSIMGAGIGGGQEGSTSEITIEGGTVTASSDYGAGIGGGQEGSTSEITIEGGTVTASSNSGAGIGSGEEGGSSSFSTGTDGHAFIDSSSISDGNDTSAWSGVIFQGDAGQVYGSPTLTTDATIPNGKTLTVPEGTSLTVAEGTTLTKNGNISVEGGTLETSVSLTARSDKGSYAYGEPITITGTVSSSIAGQISGKVNAYGTSKWSADDIVSEEPAVPDENGEFTLTIPTTYLAAGANTFSIRYIEDDKVAAETAIIIQLEKCTHREIVNGWCKVCGAYAAVGVEDGETVKYYFEEDLAGNSTAFWDYACNAYQKTPVTVTLYGAVNVGDRPLELNNGAKILLKGYGHTLTGTGSCTLNITNGELALDTGTTIENTESYGVKISENGSFLLNGGAVRSGADSVFMEGGQFTMNGGALEGSGNVIDNSAALGVAGGTPQVRISGGSLTGKDYGILLGAKADIAITGGSFAGNQYGLQVTVFPEACSLSGGTFSGEDAGIRMDGSLEETVGDLLAEGYAYYAEGVKEETSTDTTSLTVSVLKDSTSVVTGDLDTQTLNDGDGNLESDGYYWEKQADGSYVLTLKNCTVAGNIILPDDVKVTVQVDEASYVGGDIQIAQVGTYSGDYDVTFAGNGPLHVAGTIGSTGGDNNQITIAQDAAVTADGGLRISGQGEQGGTLTVNGTLNATGNTGPAVSAGKVVIHAGGSLTVSGAKGVALGGIYNGGEIDIVNAFRMEGGAFTGCCTDYNIRLKGSQPTLSEGTAETVFFFPEGQNYIPVGYSVQYASDGSNSAVALAPDNSSAYSLLNGIGLGGSITLEPQPITVNVSANHEEWGTVNGGGRYKTGEPVTVTAAPKPGYTFRCWKENDVEISGAGATYTFTAGNQNRILVAEFAQKLISVRVQTVGGTAVINKGSTKEFTIDLKENCTVTITPNTGKYVAEGFFAGNPDYAGTNPTPYTGYETMELEKASIDPTTGAVTYQFTATECIPIENDATYDYICLYFYCADIPQNQYSQYVPVINGDATAPGPDGNPEARSYESSKSLGGSDGYYTVNDQDCAYIQWKVGSFTDVNDPDRTPGGEISFEGGKLHYTPTIAEAGKTVQIVVSPDLGYETNKVEPLTFEIKVAWADAGKITNITRTLDDVKQPEATKTVQTTVKGGDHYKASLSWSPEVSGTYDFNTVYTATLTLTPTEPGYSLHSINHNGWNWKNGTSDGGAVIYKTFPATRKEAITALETIGDVTLKSHTDKAGAIQQLPGTVAATTETDRKVSLPISWSCDAFDTAPNAPNTFTWTASDNGSYDTSGVTLNGRVTVTNPEALPVNVVGKNAEISYGEAVDVSTLFQMDEHAGAASYTVSAGMLSGTTLTPAGAGTVTVTVRTAAQGIYAAGKAAATLTVKPKTLTPSVTGVGSKIYDGTTQAPQGLSIALDGVLEGDDVTAQAAHLSYDSPDAGSQTVTATGIALSGADAGNYALSGDTAELVGRIDQAKITVTAKDQTIVYGGSIAQGIDQVTVTGSLAAGDALTEVTLTADTSAGTIKPSGAVITPGGAARVRGENHNYDITYAPGRLTVQKAQPTVAFSGYPTAAEYSGTALANPTREQMTVTGADYSDIQFTWSAEPVNAGTYTLTASIPETANTEAAQASITVTVLPRAVTPAAGLSETRYVYDGTAKTPAVTLKDGDTVIPAGEYTVAYADNRDAGTGRVTVQGTDGGNYAIPETVLTFAIDPLTAELIWSGTDLTYNGQPQTPTAEVANLAPGDRCAVTVEGAETNAGEDYIATATVLSNANYRLPEGTTRPFTIRPKSVTVTVTPNGGVGGGEIKPAEVKLEGLDEGETLSVTVTYTKEGQTTGSTDVPTEEGTYTVTVTTDDPNYILEGERAVRFVVRRSVTVTAAAKSKTYGDPDPALTYTVTQGAELADKPLNITLTRSAGENAGAYAITAPGAQEDNPDYAITFVGAELTIEPKSISGAQVALGPALIANGRPQTQQISRVTVKNSLGQTMDATYTVTGNTQTAAGGYEMTITGTGNFTGQIRQPFAIAPAAGQPVQTDGSGNVILGSGTIYVQVSNESGAPALTLKTAKAAVIEAMVAGGDITAQELALVSGGQDMRVTLTSTNGVALDSVTAIQKLARGYTVGKYLGIRLSKRMDGVTAIPDLPGPVRVGIQVPQALLNTDSQITRTFWVIRSSGGGAEFLPATFDPASNTLSFETDRFSDFAIVYQDARSTDGTQNTATGTCPDTGDSSRIELWIAVLVFSALGAGAAAVIMKKKKK